MGNMNRVLAWSHARAIENLLFKVNCSKVIVDQFCNKDMIHDALMKRGKRVDLEQYHHAESDVVVAAASVVARGEFLKRLKTLGEEIGVELPRGAGEQVEKTAIELIRREGAEILAKVAKLHFKTTKKIILA
jgi:ribonuclease HIII